MAKTKTKKEVVTADQLYEQACKQLGRKPLTPESVRDWPEDEQQAFLSLQRITTVLKARREKAFDWNDKDETKYFPWWDMETYGRAVAGSGFLVGGVADGCTFSFVGARLSSNSDSGTRQVAKIMTEDYKNWMKD